MQTKNVDSLSPSERIDRSEFGHTQMIVLALCFCINMLDGFDVLAISYTAPSIADDWGIGPKSLGVVFSSGLAGMTFGAMFLGPYADRIGRRSMILWSLIVIGIGMACTALSTSTMQLIIIRMITGLGIGSMLPAMTSLVVEYTPARRKNFAIGILYAGYSVGATSGGFVAAWLVPEFGWQSLYLFAAALTAVIIPLVWALLPESLEFLITRRPRNALALVNSILHRLRFPPISDLSTFGLSMPTRASVRALLSQKLRTSTLLLWTAFFLSFISIYFVLSWIPKILVTSGLPLEQAIFAGAAINAGGILGIALLGFLADSIGLRRLVLVFLTVACLSTIAFAFSPEQLSLLLPVAALVGFFMLGGFIGLYSISAKLYPAEIRATGVGWAIGVSRFGAIIGPYAGGVMIGAGYSSQTNLIVFSLPLVCAGILAYLIPEGSLRVAR